MNNLIFVHITCSIVTDNMLGRLKKKASVAHLLVSSLHDYLPGVRQFLATSFVDL